MRNWWLSLNILLLAIAPVGALADADLGVAKTVDNATPNEGDSVVFTVTLSNLGPDDATGIQVTDLLPTGVTYQSHTTTQGTYTVGSGLWDVGAVAVSGDATLTLTATVDPGTGGSIITNTADITAADQADPNAGNNSASADITVQLADLALGKIVDDPAPNEGDAVTYTVTLSNLGPDDATGIEVTDLLPTGVTYQSHTTTQGSYAFATGLWNVGDVAVGGDATLTLTATVDPGTGGSTITNTANITAADQADPDAGNNSASAGITVQSADLEIAKGVDDSAPNEGDAVTYTVTLSNLGPDDATGIQVTDLLPAGVTYQSHTTTQGTYTVGSGLWDVGAVAVGGDATLTLTATVDPGTGGSIITNTADITAADQADPDAGNNSASADITVQSADLEIAKGVDDSAPNEGDTIEYTILLTNLGPDDATGIQATDTLPEGVTYQSHTAEQGTYSAETGLWDVGDLPLSEDVSLAILAIVDPGTGGSTITNTAAITAADQTDPNLENNESSAQFRTLAADLALTKTVDDSIPTEEDIVTFTISLTNNGPDSGTGVSVTDLLPDGLTYVSHETSQGIYNANNGLWIVGTILAGEVLDLILAASVDQGTGGETLTNTASITASNEADHDGSNNAASASVTVQVVDLAVAKTVSEEFPAEEDLVTYAVTVTNLGLDEATGVQIVDLLPEGVVYQSHTTSQGTYDDASGLWIVGSVAQGDTTSLFIDVVVETGTGGSTITNTASILQSDQIDTNEENDSASVDITIRVSLTISAFDQVSMALLPGDSIQEVFKVEIANVSDRAETLMAVTFSNKTSGPGSQDELDGDWSGLSLLVDQGRALQPISVNIESFNGGQVTFSDLNLPVPVSGTVNLSLQGGASLQARDGDTLDVVINEPQDLVFTRDIPLGGEWPLDPPGSFPVDGMAAAQISLNPVPAFEAVLGAENVLALDITVPSNGYEDDALGQIRLENIGTAEPDNDIVTVRVWKDGGNQIFDRGEGDDSLLGIAEWDGAFWVLQGLSDPVTVGGLQVFASLDVNPAANVGRTIRFGLPASPDEGLLMESDNDGPRDEPVLDPGTLVLVEDPTSTIVASAAAQGTDVMRPGNAPQQVFRLLLSSQRAVPETLKAVTFTNSTSGPGAQDDLDSDWGELFLSFGDGAQTNFEKSDSTRGTFSSGELTFADLDVIILPGEILSGIVSGQASLVARDSDSLDLKLQDPDDLVFSRSIPLQGSWPLDPPGSFIVDGMVKEQITLNPLADDEALPGTENHLVLDFITPGNGYESDILQQILVVNLGDAQPGQDIESMTFWRDGGDSTFDAGSSDDIFYGTATAQESSWRLGGLARSVPPAGIRIFCSVTLAPLATPGRTIRLALPASPDMGVTMASDNDGPLDEAVENPGTLSIRESETRVVLVTAEDLEDKTVLPGFSGERVFSLSLQNLGASEDTLESLTFTNISSGPGNPTQLDESWVPLVLAFQDRFLRFRGGADTIAVVDFSGGRASFDNLSITIPAGEEVQLTVWSGASISARDGDVLDLEITSAEDVVFSGATIPLGDFPLDADGTFSVDGMTSRQLVVNPIGPGSIVSGSTRNLAFDVILPPNGYVPDRLQQIDILNFGTAVGGADIAGMEVWIDSGDGVFTPEQDDLLGEMQESGDRWELTGVSQVVPTTGLRVFITVDVGDFAAWGRTIRLGLPSLPDPAFEMTSNNDGPIDQEIENPYNLIITMGERVALIPFPVPSGTVSPGTRNVLLLNLMAANAYDTDKTLTALSVTNSTFGPGDVEDLDREFVLLQLHDDVDNDGEFHPSTDSVLATATFSDGEARFRNLGLEIDADTSRRLFVSAQVALQEARDGDLLTIQVAGPLDIEFEDLTAVAGEWPLESGTGQTVDGMVSQQILNVPVDGLTLGPGDGPALAMDFLLPRNGYQNDTLRGLQIVNLGTAGTSEIEELRLWRDGGDGIFSGDAGDDRDLEALAWSGDRWTISTLDESLDLPQTRFFVSLKVSETLIDSSTVRLALPPGGVTVESENDGPLDASVESQETTLLDSSPLLTSLRVYPQATTLGQTITVRMIARNISQVALQDIVPASLERVGDADLAQLSGPDPTSLSLAPAQTDSFVWTFRSTSPGEARFLGNAEGRTQEGAYVSSIESISNLHTVYRGASILELFVVHNQPSVVTLGQTRINPFRFTLSNPGGPNGSPIRLNGFRIRLQDEDGRGIIPSELLTRVVVSEGNLIFLTKEHGDLETTGSEVDLTFTTPIVVTGLENVTFDLRLDISPDANASTFGLVIQDNSWFRAEDYTTGVPVLVTLSGANFPIRSDIARIVTEATSVEISGFEPDTLRAAPGQTGVSLLTLIAQNVATEESTSDAQMGGFAVTLTDADGNVLEDPTRFLSTLRVRTALQTLAESPLGAESGDSLALDFNSGLTLPVNSPTEIRVTGDLIEDAELGSFRLRLHSESSFDIRDVNTRDPVPTIFLSESIEGHTVILERPAERILMGGVPEMPGIITAGENNVTALAGWFVHPGEPGTARIRVEQLAVDTWEEGREPVPPGMVLKRLSLWVGNVPVASVTDLPMTGSLAVLAIDDLVIGPGDSTAFRLLLDVAPDPSSSSLELTIGDDDIQAVDANSSQPVALEPGPGQELPLSSGLAHLQEASTELLVKLTSQMPVTIAGDRRVQTVATLSLTNPAQEGSGDIEVGYLRVEAADRDFLPLSIGRTVEKVVIYRGETGWGESAILTADSMMAFVPFPEIVKVEPGQSVDLAIRASFKADDSVSDIRLGWNESGIGIMQPEDPLLRIDVRVEDGSPFPIWTDAGTFTPASLHESYANFPNPFAAGGEVTSFVYYLDMNARVSLRIWTIRGEKVIDLFEDEDRPAGLHQETTWDGRNGRGDLVRNGIYIAELEVRFADGRSERLLHKVAVAR